MTAKVYMVEKKVNILVWWFRKLLFCWLITEFKDQPRHCWLQVCVSLACVGCSWNIAMLSCVSSTATESTLSWYLSWYHRLKLNAQIILISSEDNVFQTTHSYNQLFKYMLKQWCLVYKYFPGPAMSQTSLLKLGIPGLVFAHFDMTHFRVRPNFYFCPCDVWVGERAAYLHPISHWMVGLIPDMSEIFVGQLTCCTCTVETEQIH